MKRKMAVMLMVSMIGATAGNTGGIPYSVKAQENVEAEHTTVTTGGAVTATSEEDFKLWENGDIIWIKKYLGTKKNVVVPETIHGRQVALENRAFAEKDIESICFEGKIEEASSDIFEDCENLKSVTFQKGIKHISDGMFEGCKNLEEISFGEDNKEGEAISCTAIEDYAFSGCKKLSKFFLPDTVEKLGSWAFMESGITEIALPKNLKEMDGRSLYGMNLQKLTLDPENQNFVLEEGNIYDKEKTKLVVVAEQQEILEMADSVTCIGTYAARDNTILKSVKWTSGLKKVEEGAFEGCVNLEKADLPDTVTELGSEAFYNCKKLKSVHIPKNLKEIPAKVFYNTALSKVHIPASVSFIDWGECDNSFGSTNIKTCTVDSKNPSYSVAYGSLCNKKKTVIYIPMVKENCFTIPKTVKQIYGFNGGFQGWGMESCKVIKVVSGNKYFSAYDGALYNKSGKKLIYVPKGKTSIVLNPNVYELEARELLSAHKLKKIQIKLKNKYYATYQGILYDKKKKKIIVAPVGIDKIVLPKTVEEIDALLDASTDCVDYEVRLKSYQNIKNIVLEKGNKYFYVKDGILYDKKDAILVYCPKGKTKVNVAKGTKGIGPCAFAACRKLETVQLPNTIEDISTRAFQDCRKLKYLQVPDKCKDLGHGFMYNCQSMQYIYIPKVKSIDNMEDMFAGCSNIKYVYYAGTEKEWKKLKEESWDGDYSTIVYEADLDIWCGKRGEPEIVYNASVPK